MAVAILRRDDGCSFCDSGLHFRLHAEWRGEYEAGNGLRSERRSRDHWGAERMRHGWSGMC